MDGFEIPIGGDLSSLQSAFEAVIAAVDRMGAQITAAFTASSAAMMQANAAAMAAATSQSQAGNAATSSASKFANAASVAGSLGEAMQGAATAATLVNRATRAMTGVNLASALASWANRAGGIRAAFAAIPAVMSAIVRNPVFRRIAIGAAVAVTGIIAIRTATRVVSAALNTLSRAATATFRGIASAARAAGNVASSAFKGIASMMPGGLPIMGLVGGLGGIAGLVGGAVASIGKAAQMETLEAAFAPLLGSADKAEARIADLAKFARDTPFEMPEIASASRMLEVLTRGALSTGKALTLVGDVASGLGAPFEDLAMWIGRLYDGLQSGRPVGEAMMRLQELGVISGEVRGRLEAMQKSKALGPEIWKEAEAALGRFGGSMERQSVTWAGKISNFKDGVSALMAEFGKPIIDALKPFLDMAIQRVEQLRETAKTMGNAVREAFDFTRIAFQSGNIGEVIGAGLHLALLKGINAFSSGVRQTVAYLSAAVGGIFSSIGETMKASGILAVFQMLADAMAMSISSAIMSAMGKITGKQSFNDVAKSESNAAASILQSAGNVLSNLDFEAAMKAASSGFGRADSAGRRAATEAGNQNIVDESGAQAKWDSVSASVKKGVEDFRKSTEAAKAAMDAKLGQKTAGIISPAAAVNKAVAPSVMSLARIGGGGDMSSAGFQNLAGEARKQTSVLRLILRKLEQPARPISARYA